MTGSGGFTPGTPVSTLFKRLSKRYNEKIQKDYKKNKNRLETFNFCKPFSLLENKTSISFPLFSKPCVIEFISRSSCLLFKRHSGNPDLVHGRKSNMKYFIFCASRYMLIITTWFQVLADFLTRFNWIGRIELKENKAKNQDQFNFTFSTLFHQARDSNFKSFSLLASRVFLCLYKYSHISLSNRYDWYQSISSSVKGVSTFARRIRIQANPDRDAIRFKVPITPMIHRNFPQSKLFKSSSVSKYPSKVK